MIFAAGRICDTWRLAVGVDVQPISEDGPKFEGHAVTGGTAIRRGGGLGKDPNRKRMQHGLEREPEEPQNERSSLTVGFVLQPGGGFRRESALEAAR